MNNNNEIGCGNTHEDELHMAKLGGAEKATDWTTGVKNVVCIRADFSDALWTSAVNDLVQLQNASVQLQRYSNGKTSLAPVVSSKVYRMPHPSSYYNNLQNTQSRFAAMMAIHADASSLAANDYSLSVDAVIVHTPHIQLNYGGFTHTGYKEVHMNGQFNPRLLCHELGHRYGCFHAYRIDATQKWIDYGDRFDIMGGDWSPNQNLDFNMKFKRLLGWDTSVQQITTSGQYRVYAFDVGVQPYPHALVIPRGDGSNLYVQMRGKFSPDHAYIVTDSTKSAMTGLIDCVPSTDSQDALWPIGQPLNDTKSIITPVASGTGYLDVKIEMKP